MEGIYLFFIIVLFALAISDLVVGVSNDAVNFLNSSIGSKVASRKTIMIVASAGIAIGATFSSGMMEVARKGIFNPEMFVFADLMVVFLAVMITDIILLDLFNTFGMPTSTTVSIVFELLGAAVAVSLLKIITGNQSIFTLVEYINYEKAVQIIIGIFLSVFVAFAIGWLVQYITRVAFTFNFEENLNKYGVLFGGLAITFITYFILIKGAKGSSFISDDTNTWIKNNTLMLVGLSFLFWLALTFMLNKFLKVHVLKMVVLIGTFALAMAFAGNDLVNFIGVPVAGLESFKTYQASGMGAAELGMGFLRKPVRTSTLLLLIAGAVMVITLWFSKKARTVTETEVNLGRQGFGTERFRPNLLARWMVRGGIKLGKAGNSVLPQSSLQKLKQKFNKEIVQQAKGTNGDKEPPAFDLVRASVNLTVASILIAFATSLKLPLSTTYVSFMVAMGTSLADRAWDRETAVYRVAGVLNVIGGWFSTAIIAFSAAALFAVVIYFGGLYGVIGLLALAVFLVVRSSLIHSEQSKGKSNFIQRLLTRDVIEEGEVIIESSEVVAKTLKACSRVFEDAVTGLKKEDRRTLKRAKKDIKKLEKQTRDLKAGTFLYIQKIESENSELGHFYLMVLDSLQDMVQSVEFIATSASEHIENNHAVLPEPQYTELKKVSDQVVEIFRGMENAISKNDYEKLLTHQAEKKQVINELHDFLTQEIKRIRAHQSSPRNSILYLGLLLEIQDIMEASLKLLEVHSKQMEDYVVA